MSIEFDLKLKDNERFSNLLKLVSFNVENFNDVISIIDQHGFRWIEQIEEDKKNAILNLKNHEGWTIAHELAKNGYLIDDKDIKKITTPEGFSVEDEYNRYRELKKSFNDEQMEQIRLGFEKNLNGPSFSLQEQMKEKIEEKISLKERLKEMAESMANKAGITLK
ncbi:MAG: hypothetical protein ACOCP4_03120 [Candidatus Woesearchaeota archaeon]